LKNKKWDNYLVWLIAGEYQPFILLKDAEFRRFVQMCPGYQIRSKKTLTKNLIPMLCHTTLKKVQAVLNVATAVSLTAGG
jgi:hypothetical protein